jgi:hypothetical protein
VVSSRPAVAARAAQLAADSSLGTLHRLLAAEWVHALAASPALELGVAPASTFCSLEVQVATLLAMMRCDPKTTGIRLNSG